MSEDINPIYSPALRMKAGELTGLQSLSADIADRVLPRLIVPPPKERDRKLAQELFRLPEQPRIHGVLGQHWTGRAVLLQCSYLMREVTADPKTWLPALFSDAREHGIEAIPAFTICEINDATLAAASSLSQFAGLQLALIISSAELADPDLEARLGLALKSLRLDSANCAILADFADADLSEPEIAAPIISASFERLQELGSWKYIAFQGTSFPEHNPAAHNQTHRVDRNEWFTWTAAVNYRQDTPSGLLFGDFAADCAKMTFGKSQARAIRHLRYATSECWYVIRAPENGRDAARMQEVCRRVLNSDWYDGRHFSAADDHIFKMAHAMVGPGTATDWRSINTCHHISRVVRDLGVVKSVPFSGLDERKLEHPPQTFPLLFVPPMLGHRK